MLKQIELGQFTNVQKLIGKDWMLITAGDEDKANTMTASWGCLGELWHRPVAICFIRPQRYTFEFAEKSDTLSLSFFDGERREALSLCGKVSGRDRDKITEAGLSVAYCDGTPYIAEAHHVLICRKLYADDIREDKFLVPGIIERHYPIKDFHRFYICEIVKVLSDM